MQAVPRYTIAMHIQEHVSLRQHSTMRLGGEARYLAEITNREELNQALDWATDHGVSVLMIGDGSNIVWRDEGYDGLILVNKIKQFEHTAEGEYDHFVTIGAGENWDSVVGRCVELGLSGIEALSLIPGTAGATPVQNVGAYGQEIANTLVSVEAYDTQAGQFVTIPNTDCDFGYRTSRFKTRDHGRFCIISINLHLSTAPPQPPFYGQLQRYLDEHGHGQYTCQIIRDAVIDIRSHKLPDPAVVANNGSFFANPIISKDAFQVLVEQHPDVPHWETRDGTVKLAAAWLIEHVGFKDAHDPETGMATWPTQPLVLVNEQATSTAQLLAFRQKIVNAVQQTFGITLTQEPELLPLTH